MGIKIDYKLIKSFYPCESGLINYKKHFGTKQTTLEVILNSNKIPPKDKIWLAVRVMPRHLVEIFIIDCYFSAMNYVDIYSRTYKGDSAFYAVIVQMLYEYMNRAENSIERYIVDDAIFAPDFSAHIVSPFFDDIESQRENQVDVLLWLLKAA